MKIAANRGGDQYLDFLTRVGVVQGRGLSPLISKMCAQLRMRRWLDCMAHCFPMLQPARRFTLVDISTLPPESQDRLLQWKRDVDLEELRTKARHLATSTETTPTYSVRGSG